MKTFDELNEKQQASAINTSLSSLLETILESAIRFNDEANHDNLQARIDAACQKAEAMKTPWFAHEYILDTCLEDLEGMARCQAEDTIYYSDQMVTREPEV